MSLKRHYTMTSQRQKSFSTNMFCGYIISVCHVNLNVIGWKTWPGEPKNEKMTSLRHDVATSKNFFDRYGLRLYHISLPCQFERDWMKNLARRAKKRIDDVITSWTHDVIFWGHDFLRSILSCAPFKLKKSDLAHIASWNTNITWL